MTRTSALEYGGDFEVKSYNVVARVCEGRTKQDTNGQCIQCLCMSMSRDSLGL